MEEALLDFISEYARNRSLHNATSRKEIFASVKNTILKIAKDPNEAKALNVFDYVSWLESKVANTSFREWKEKSMKPS